MNHTLTVQKDQDGEHYIVLPSDVLLKANINIGDDVEWAINGRTATLTKVDKND